jgi:hypothetical protein
LFFCAKILYYRIVCEWKPDVKCPFTEFENILLFYAKILYYRIVCEWKLDVKCPVVASKSCKNNTKKQGDVQEGLVLPQKPPVIWFVFS